MHHVGKQNVRSGLVSNTAVPHCMYSLNTTINPAYFGKQVVHPSYVYGRNVHRGKDFPESPPHINPGGFTWLRHFVNLFHTRGNDKPGQ